jgi:hypothetical protein
MQVILFSIEAHRAHKILNLCYTGENPIQERGNMKTDLTKDFMFDGVSYRLQYRTCSKKECVCHRGQKHGPYWYGYGEMKPVYFGKELPQTVIKAIQKRDNQAAKIVKAIKKLQTEREKLEQKIEQMQDKEFNLSRYLHGEAYQQQGLFS